MEGAQDQNRFVAGCRPQRKPMDTRARRRRVFPQSVVRRCERVASCTAGRPRFVADRDEPGPVSPGCPSLSVRGTRASPVWRRASLRGSSPASSSLPSFYPCLCSYGSPVLRVDRVYVGAFGQFYGGLSGRAEAQAAHARRDHPVAHGHGTQGSRGASALVPMCRREWSGSVIPASDRHSVAAHRSTHPRAVPGARCS